MAGSVGGSWSLEPFKRTDDAGTTADRLEKYLKRAELMFKILPKEDGEQVLSDIKKKALIQIWGGEDLIYIWETMAKPAIDDNTTYVNALEQVKAGLRDQTNELFPIYNLFTRMPQGKKPTRSWMQEVLDAAKRCKFSSTCTANCVGAYTAERAARDAVVFQTSNDRLRKKALAEAPDFTELLKIGQSMETAEYQADKISTEEYSSASSRHVAEEYDTEIERTIARVLDKQLRFNDRGYQGRGRGQNSGRGRYDGSGQADAGSRASLPECPMCQLDWPKPNHYCPALTVPCSTCGALGHWTRPSKDVHPQCKATKRSENGATEYKAPSEATRTGETARRLEEEDYRGYVDSIGGGYAYDPELGVYSTRAVFQQITPATTATKRLVKVKVNGTDVGFICDSGTDITTISEKDWTRIESESTTDGLKPTEVRLKPYGTALAGVESLVPLAGQSRVTLTAVRGASIETLIVVARGEAANLLGEREATELGILKIETAGASTARGTSTQEQNGLEEIGNMKGSRPMPGLMEYSDHEDQEQKTETKSKPRKWKPKQRKKNRKHRL